VLYAVRALALVALLALWQVFGNYIVGTFWISSPMLVARQLGHWLANGYLMPQIGVTLEEGIGGFVIGTLVGGILGIVFGYFRSIGRVIEPLLVALYSLPVIALAPLFILWFGIGEVSKVMVAAVTVLFLVFFNTYAGLREVDEQLINATRILGANTGQILTKVVLPNALTWIFVGLKIALPFGLIGAVVAEIVSSNKGLGFVMETSVNQFDTTGVFVCLVVIAVLSVLLGGILRALEGVTLKWRPDPH
jgi:NitT/TauT family transport system permease protein